MNPTALLAVAFGGALGCVLRYLVSIWLTPTTSEPSPFPLATFVVNLAGAFLIGLLAFGVKEAKALPDTAWLLLVTGFLGGLTTFSTYCNETFQLLRQNQFGWAALYCVSSMLLGLLGVWLGFVLGRGIWVAGG